MIKVAEAVREIVDHDPGLKTGLAQKLMNLTQVDGHVNPRGVARTHKGGQRSAVTMALARLRSDLPSCDEKPDLGLADRITVQRGLVVLTFPNSARVQSGLLRLQESVREARRYLTITEGIREITLITEQAMLDRVHEAVGERPARIARGIASLSVSLSEDNLAAPGVLYRILQALALQGVNLAEVASTTTEFHIYLAEDDVMLALDSLYGAFR